jgi:hypothetical protein
MRIKRQSQMPYHDLNFKPAARNLQLRSKIIKKVELRRVELLTF